MKVKLDENLGRQSQELFRRHGHDVATVPGQGLSSVSDATLIEACRKEKRCLVTLDLDFGNPLLFKPSHYAGIAVLRLSAKPSRTDLVATVETLIAGFVKSEISGKLWIVQRGGIREYQEETGE